MKDVALAHLRTMTGSTASVFHDDQWESIERLVTKQQQLLVVQRTGWGKSAVYFIATKIRCSQGFGPTLIVSPLLSLIRNQIESAAKLGLKVVSYNSSMSNADKDSAESEILAGNVDAVIIAPEQLGQSYFAENVLTQISSNIGLFVVDEAHFPEFEIMSKTALDKWLKHLVELGLLIKPHSRKNEYMLPIGTEVPAMGASRG